MAPISHNVQDEELGTLMLGHTMFKFQAAANPQGRADVSHKLCAAATGQSEVRAFE